MGCNTELLKDVNVEKAKQFIESHDDPAFIRFWSETNVQIDGDCKVQFLKDLVTLMESFE